MSPQAQAATAMSGNLPQQPGPIMPTQTPPAGNQSLVQPAAEQLARTTGQPMQTPVDLLYHNKHPVYNNNYNFAPVDRKAHYHLTHIRHNKEVHHLHNHQ